MEAPVVRQSAEALFARKGKELVIVVDGTSRAYDLWTIAFGTAAINTNATQPESCTNTKFFVTMTADGGDVYYLFGATSPTVDETAAVAAGAGLAYTANAADVIPAGKTLDGYLTRGVDRFLAIKTTAVGTVRLRIHVSSLRNDTQASA